MRVTGSEGRVRVVAFGGGHGLAASLAALRRIPGVDITAVVGVADDGGSSGRLRAEFGILPPGDLRMALAALCGDDSRGDDSGDDDAAASVFTGRHWAEVLQHRFAGDGVLAGHAVGNLLIAGLWQLQDDPIAGLDAVADLVGAHGRVLPCSTVPLVIAADVAGLDPDEPEHVRIVRGQVAVAKTPGQIERIALEPANPPACPEALKAIDAADVLVLGPGSWFTSVLPHLLIPAQRDAIEASAARRALILNLDPKADIETAGVPASEHLRSLLALAPGLRLDDVIADPAHVEDASELARAAAELGARVHFASVGSDPPARDQHDPARLAAALERIVRPPGDTPESGE